MATITFAIPFYRNRVFLERAIRSVLAQTSPDWSLVISDDAGPEENLRDWLDQFPHHEKIRFVRQPHNLGMAGNWNACIALAEGELVTLLHADDELEPTYAALMLDAAQRRPAASVFFCQATIIDVQGRPRFSFPDWIKRWLLPVRGREFTVVGDAGLRAVLRGNFIMCPSMCYRRRDLPTVPFDARWKQVLDLDYIAQRLFAGQQFVGLPQTAYRYRRHASNQTQLQSDSLLRFEEERDVYRKIAAAAQSHGWSRAAGVASGMAIVKWNLLFCAAQHLGRGRLADAWRKAAFLASM
jgi:glycosyltransferase involved in cell wall biosynthesis